ncbi:MAG: hypothetical protein DI539_07725 [Flavobacterium psychrophilum]|nr:MAG: hypothetical protein DI539_07725 [Flavobacterium psychrophilum]
MIKKLSLVVLLTVFLATFFSCGYTKEDAENYLPGHYLYKIPSGELQVLNIYPDFTFSQVVYSRNKKVLYKNNGKMYVDGNEIEFDHWLECYELADAKMLPEPYTTYSTGSYWEKPKGNKDVLIVEFDQTGYIFRKVSSFR